MVKSPKLYLSIALYLLVSLFAHAQKGKQFFLDKAWNYPQTSTQFRTVLDSALKAYPNDAQLWREVATSYFKSGMYSQAMKYIDRAVELDPKRWLGYRAFMKCVFMKDYAHAITDFKTAIALKHSIYEMDHTFYFYMGISYLKTSRLDSANYYMQLSVETQKPQDKKNVHYVDWHYWGLICLHQKNDSQALQYFDNALEQFSNFPDALYYKATLLLHEKKKADATALLQAAEKALLSGYHLNEDNEIYVNYPFQITLPDVQKLLNNL